MCQESPREARRQCPQHLAPDLPCCQTPPSAAWPNDPDCTLGAHTADPRQTPNSQQPFAKTRGPRKLHPRASTEMKTRYQAYWNEDQHLLWAGRGWRPPNVGERKAIMGLPSGRTERPDTDNWEQLAGNAFHTAVLKRILLDSPWAIGRVSDQEGMGLLVAGQDMGSTRMAVYRLLGDFRGSCAATRPLVWGVGVTLSHQGCHIKGRFYLVKARCAR